MKSMSFSMLSRMKSRILPSFWRGSSESMKGSYSSQVTSVFPIQKGERVTCRVSVSCLPCQVNVPAFTGSISNWAPDLVVSL